MTITDPDLAALGAPTITNLRGWLNRFWLVVGSKISTLSEYLNVTIEQNRVAGEYMWYGGTGTPDGGWLLCDGSAISRTVYSALFNAVGTTYGVGDGATTFNLPDGRGRALFAPDNMGSGAAGTLPSAALADTGGTYQHTLVTDEIPAHSHATVQLDTLSNLDATAPTAAVGTTSSNTGSSNSTGGGQPHTNMPPYLIAQLFIKY